MGQSSSKSRSSKPQKILLLGTEGSGKTTFINQVMQINGVERGEKDLNLYKYQIQEEVMRTFQRTVQSIGHAAWKQQEPHNFKHHRIISEYEHRRGNLTPDFVVEAMEKMCCSKLFWSAFKGIEFPPNIDYFYDDLHRLFSPNYTPTHNDIIHFYKKTGDMKELKIEGVLKILEIAGSRYARRRWIQSLEKFEHVLFFASSTLNISSSEFEESLVYFETICNSRLFSSSRIILVLTHIDKAVSKHDGNYQFYNQDLDAIRARYFEVVGHKTPVFEVNLTSQMSVERFLREV